MYSKKSKYLEYAKYQKYKSKYLELQKSISQFNQFGQFGGGIQFRIRIDQNIKNFIDSRTDLKILQDVFTEKDKSYDIDTDKDKEVAIKLLDLCKENPSWNIREGNERISKDDIHKLAWKKALYILSSDKQVLAPGPGPEPILDQYQHPALLEQLIKDLPAGFVKRFRLEAFAETKVKDESYLDLRTKPNSETAHKFVIESHYTPTICNGHPIKTVFDKGNSNVTLCSLNKVKDLKLDMTHKMASKNSILMYNILVETCGRGQLNKINKQAPQAPQAPRVQSERKIHTLQVVADSFIEDESSVNYQETTLEEFIKLLDLLLPNYINEIPNGHNMTKTEQTDYLYRHCGLKPVSGVNPGASDLYLYETYLPIESAVVDENGMFQPKFKFLVKADVGNPGVDLLISDEDIRKLSLYGAKVEYVKKSHQKRDEIIELKRELEEIELDINIQITILNNADAFGRVDDIVYRKLRRLRKLQHEKLVRLKDLYKCDIPIRKLN